MSLKFKVREDKYIKKINITSTSVLKPKSKNKLLIIKKTFVRESPLDTVYFKLLSKLLTFMLLLVVYLWKSQGN